MSTKGNWLLLDEFSSTQQQSGFFVEALRVTRLSGYTMDELAGSAPERRALGYCSCWPRASARDRRAYPRGATPLALRPPGGKRDRTAEGQPRATAAARKTPVFEILISHVLAAGLDDYPARGITISVMLQGVELGDRRSGRPKLTTYPTANGPVATAQDCALDRSRRSEPALLDEGACRCSPRKPRQDCWRPVQAVRR